MLVRTAVCLLIAFVVAACDRRESGGSSEPVSADSPVISLVDVAPAVKLEVLEWSTHGAPLVLLAGAVQTAHMYEAFAPYFTDRFRVVGITRRRHGASSVPPQDFGIDALVDDIVAVLDAKRIPKAHFVAFSFGGAELSGLAARYPDRVDKLTFLDAAWDFYDMYYADGWWEGWPDVPLTDDEKASPQAVASYIARIRGAYPTAEILAANRFDASGTLMIKDPNIGNMFPGMIKASLRPLTYAGLDKPMLIVRAIPRTVEDMFPGYWSFDPANQQRATRALEKWTQVVVSSADRFVARVPHARVVRLDGAAHSDVVVAHAGRLVPELRHFLLQ